MANTNVAVEDIFYASVVGDIELLKRSLEEGANVDQIDEDGSTPLMLAAVNGQKDAVEFLLRKGADPSRKDREGRSAASMARDAGYGGVAAIIEKHSGGLSSAKVYPEILEEVAIVAFVQEKAEEIKSNLERIGENLNDEGLIKETDHLMLALFAEASAFSKHVDRETRSVITGTLEYLNENSAAIALLLGREGESVEVSSIKDYNVSKLLGEDERMLSRITREIYNALVEFAQAELGINPKDFSIKYEEYHERLLKMRSALLGSLREFGEGKPEMEESATKVNIIGRKSGAA